MKIMFRSDVRIEWEFGNGRSTQLERASAHQHLHFNLNFTLMKFKINSAAYLTQ